MQVIFVLGQVVQASGGGRVAFIGQVIGGSGKPVNGTNGGAQVRWAQERGDRKIFVMIHALGGLRGAHRAGSHTAEAMNGLQIDSLSLQIKLTNQSVINESQCFLKSESCHESCLTHHVTVCQGAAVVARPVPGGLFKAGAA
jgi:hypothetical protein